jgi:hypothetical protein
VGIEILGHMHISITGEVYTFLLPELQWDAASGHSQVALLGG